MSTPGFYAILPASVRYDNRLKAAEKIFYAEITALADKTGYCYAGNGYFCELYNTAERTVQRWVKHLQELGYLSVSYAREDGSNQRRLAPLSGTADLPEGGDKNVAERHPMSPGDKNVAPTPTKLSPTPRQNCHPEQYKINTTRESNTRARAGARAEDIFRAAYPADEALTKTLLSFAESRAAGKHPLSANAAELACTKLERLADDAHVRNRSAYMIAVLEQSILRGWEGLFALKDDFVDSAPTTQPPDTADRPREIGADDDISAYL